ncbi:MAG: transposase [Deltaproteobacteria bacterium]|nr:transposase [Deltaproteobacteria bacterium]
MASFQAVVSEEDQGSDDGPGARGRNRGRGSPRGNPPPERGEAKRRGRKSKELFRKPDPETQRNFTDPDSRIMKDDAACSFEQCYNCQAAVDDKAQVIVAGTITQQANDKQQLKPVLENLKENTRGKKPKILSADAGFFSICLTHNFLKLFRSDVAPQ